MRILFGIFILLHGLVHLWYVTLSQGWVQFQPSMGWSGKSWLLSSLLAPGLTQWVATVLYGLAAAAFAVAGVGRMANQDWSRPWLTAASLVSILAIVLFWDGSFKMPVEKGILGLLISIGLLVAAYAFK